MLEIPLVLLSGFFIILALLSAVRRLCNVRVFDSLSTLTRSLLEVIGLVIASTLLTAIICGTPLGFLWLYVLIHAFHVPMAVQTGADYRAHPIFDHPAFFPLTIFVPLLFTAILGYAVMWRTRRSRQPNRISRRHQFRILTLMIVVALVAIVLTVSMAARRLLAAWRLLGDVHIHDSYIHFGFLASRQLYVD